MANPPDAVDLGRAYFAAEMSRSLEAVLDLFAAGGKLVTPAGAYTGEGLAAFYADSIARFPGLDITIAGLVTGSERAAFEWDATFTAAGGATTRLRGVNVFQVAAGRIEEIHAYYDEGSYRA